MAVLKLYPDFFPNNCPPVDAVEAKIDVFRYTKNSPPTEEDFKSHYEMEPEKYLGVIDAYGLSVISNLESAKNGLNLNPGLRKKFKYIAEGNLTTDCGVIKQTPSRNQKYHMTWWLYKNVEPSMRFKVCKI